MPRDASGNFSLVAGNPVVTGTVITSNWANSTMPDIAQGIQDSLDRNGRGGMLVPFRVPDGSGAAPSYSYTNEPTLGTFRAGAGQIGFAVGGAARATMSATLHETMIPTLMDAQNIGTQLTIKQGSLQTENIVRVTSNDELTDYMTIDSTGNASILTLSVTDLSILTSAQLGGVGLATLGSNTFTGLQVITYGSPTTIMQDTGGATNAKNWKLRGSANDFNLFLTSDNGVIDNPVITSVRSGTTSQTLTLTATNMHLSGTTAQFNSVDLATVNTNWLLSDITDITATATEVNYTDGVTSAIQTQLNAKAPIANPTFTGEIGVGVVNVSETELGILEGATLTTSELNYVDGVTSAIQPQLNLKAPLASPPLTGVPTAPTAAVGTNTTQLATTAFVQGEKGVFSNNADGTPTLSATTYSIVPSQTAAVWETVGPTGSGATNIWTALDAVPSGVDWVEIRFYLSAFDGTANTDSSLEVGARDTGSVIGLNVATAVGAVSARNDSTGNSTAQNIATSKIQVTSRVFELRYSSSFSSPSANAALVGYGTN